MKKINKILILFIAICLLTFWGGWTFIHSKKFSEAASKRVSYLLTKKIGAQLSFEGVEFNMFPPSTIFKNVVVTKNDPNKFNIAISLKEFGVYFTYASFLGGNLEIDELLLKDGDVVADILKKDDSDIDWKNLKLDEVFDKYTEYYSKSPVTLNLLKLSNINIQVDKFQGSVNDFVLMPHKKNIRAKLLAKNIKLLHEVEGINIPKFDEVEVRVSANRKNIEVEILKVKSGVNSITVNGKLEQVKKLHNLDSTIGWNIDVASLNQIFKKPIDDLKKTSAIAKGEIKLKGDILNLAANGKLEVINLFSPYINLETASVEFSKKRELIFINSIAAKNKNEKYKMIKGGPLFDLNKKWFVKTHGTFEIENAFTNTFLYAIKDTLDVFKGVVSGRVDVGFDGDKVFFHVDKGFLKDFKLVFPKAKKPLLQNNGFNLDNLLVTIDGKNNVGIDGNVSMPESLLKIKGVIAPKSIDLIVSDSKINLKSFGPISGIALSGSGPINLTINGPMEDVRFAFDVNWKQFGLLDLNFGEVKSHFTLSLADVMLSIDNLTGKFNETNFDANGWLQFGDKSGLDLKLNFPGTSFADARAMYQLVFKGMKLPSDLNLKFSTKYRVYGDFDLPNLKIDGAINGRELKVLGEDFDLANFDINLLNQELKLKNIKLKKSRGEVLGYANISLLNGYTELEASGSGMRLSDFNFYKKLNLSYDSDLNIDYDGNGTKDTFSSRLKFKTIEPFIGNMPASNSSGLIYINHDEIIAKVGLLGNKIKMDSIYDFTTSNVTLKSAIDTSDIKEILGIVSSHNISDKKISGQVKASLNTKFNANNLTVNKFLMDIKQFKLKRDDVDLSVDPTKNQIDVENGIVKKWNLSFRDGKEFFNSKGSNTTNNGIICEQNFNIKSNFLELLHPSIERARGVIKGYNTLLIDNKLLFRDFRFSSSNGIVKIKKMPGVINELNYEVVKNGNRFDISRFNGKYGDGDLTVGGSFVFESLFPLVNLDVKLDKSIIPLFKKSNIVLSATGQISGNSFPYNLNAKAIVNRGDIYDDLEDITNQNVVSLDEYSKYLPNKSDKNSNLLNLNISFDTQNPVLMKNNMLELYAKASGQLTGEFLNPEINTRVDIQPSISKFKFKGHDFILNQGYVEIHDKSKLRSSDLKFVGQTKINEFDIKLDVSGKIEKININFTSEPARSQEDIISLLALGVTNDMSRNLDPNERASIARVGIGSLFLDQLKVNEDLNSSIGVNVSVLPEFQEEESSLVSSGKSAVSDSSSSKLKSATKIKVNKKLTNKIDVSVSSTVGGTIEQKQEMNVNVNVNKNISLEGVYELKSSEEDSANNPTSIGADLKFKWSF